MSASRRYRRGAVFSSMRRVCRTHRASNPRIAASGVLQSFYSNCSFVLIAEATNDPRHSPPFTAQADNRPQVFRCSAVSVGISLITILAGETENPTLQVSFSFQLGDLSKLFGEYVSPSNFGCHRCLLEGAIGKLINNKVGGVLTDPNQKVWLK